METINGWATIITIIVAIIGLVYSASNTKLANRTLNEMKADRKYALGQHIYIAQIKFAQDFATEYVAGLHLVIKIVGNRKHGNSDKGQILLQDLKIQSDRIFQLVLAGNLILPNNWGKTISELVNEMNMSYMKPDQISEKHIDELVEKYKSFTKLIRNHCGIGSLTNDNFELIIPDIVKSK